jgi:hypothetical protein
LLSDFNIETDLYRRDKTIDFNITFNNDQKTFKVLRVLLTTYAPSLTGLYRYPGIKSVTLTDVPVQSFEVFLGWLYYEYFNHKDGVPRPWDHKTRVVNLDLMNENGYIYYDSNDPLMWNASDKHVVEHAEAAIEMYIFAGTYEIPRLRLDAIDRLVWCHNRIWATGGLVDCPLSYIGQASLTRAYENTLKGDKIGDLLSQGYYELGDHKDEALLVLPKELLAKISGWALRCTPFDFGVWDSCDFHEHMDHNERDACQVRVQMRRGIPRG